ncbi:MAG: phosphoglycerate kinase [Ancrocorticia sp.]|nr:phosphoglycerate kinase [Ancrocorticia sp.]MCI2002290.1 phosphoglycerate kinase [Ancrocorticia sp.]MCI2012520.1 phosphoglycerate kinase [Ancrocorticia sp.]MCI2029080.1 phosphoglycerate kinase [Ancrocorticia sp.]
MRSACTGICVQKGCRFVRTIDSLGDLAGKTVFVRSDFNVPLDEDRHITDDGRIRAALPTLRRLVKAKARVVVAAHLGRPKGKVNPAFSLAPVAARLSELLGQPVPLAGDTVGDDAKAKIAALKDGDVVLLENVRFDPREDSKVDAERESLAREYAALADVFVSDGFGVVHRKQASVYDVAKLLPSAAGELVFKEIESLSRATKNPERPYTVVLGGAKVSDKLGVINNLIEVADRLIIGGGMAYTFLKAEGKETGTSLLEEDQVDTAASYLAKAKDKGVEILLPVDTVVAPKFAADAPHEVVDVDSIPADQMGLDIGPKSGAIFAAAIADSKTIVWNGPMGVFEFPTFAEGTKAVAQAMQDAAGFTIVGGGDSAAAVRNLGFDESKFSHISTGGGASLEFLEGKVLPGIAVLED